MSAALTLASLLSVLQTVLFHFSKCYIGQRETVASCSAISFARWLSDKKRRREMASRTRHDGHDEERRDGAGEDDAA